MKEIVCIYLLNLFIKNSEVTSKAKWQRQRCGQMEDKKAQKRDIFSESDFITFELLLHIENLKEIV